MGSSLYLPIYSVRVQISHGGARDRGNGGGRRGRGRFSGGIDDNGGAMRAYHPAAVAVSTAAVEASAEVAEEHGGEVVTVDAEE
ncbi:hypothetical protein U1Q18_004617 [Sarracenia purpurea var. burkii]